MRIKSSDEVDKRVCIKCGIPYPLQEKYFAYAHGSTTRFLTKCRDCIKEYQEEYRENIYWCKKDDCVQITEDICGACNKPMEKIGFVDYNEDDAK